VTPGVTPEMIQQVREIDFKCQQELIKNSKLSVRKEIRIKISESQIVLENLLKKNDQYFPYRDSSHSLSGSRVCNRQITFYSASNTKPPINIGGQ